MNYSEVLNVFLEVIKNPKIIIIFVIIFVYLNFVIYVVRYKKKPPVPKKHIVADKPKEQKESEESDSE